MNLSHGLALLVGGWLAIVSWRWVARRWRAALLSRRFARAQRKEREAPRLLRRAGYTVLASQVEREFSFWVGGEPVLVHLRADYLVSKRGRLYVAEVKSGQRAPDPTERATRRQLLEYRAAYEVDGVLLVNAEARSIAEVRFPRLAATSSRGFGLGFLAGMAGSSLFFWFWVMR
jgi:PD-(D/E)XK nuclease superfamily